MANLNDGEVMLILGDQRYLLRPTLNAIRNLSRLHGGLRNTFQKIVNQDFEGIVEIIKIGGGISDREQNALAARVYEAGLTDDTLMPLIEYMKILMNGGRVPSEAPATTEAPEGNG